MKSKKKVAIIIAIVAVIIIGALVAVYFLTDVFKTPEQLFYKYLGNIAKAESDYSYQDMLKDLETTQTKSYNANSTIGIELKDNGSGYSSRKTQSTYDEVNKVKVDLQQKSLPKDNKAYYNVGLKYDNKDITNVELLKTGDLYGVKSELLDDKYIALENNNLKEFFGKLGVDTTIIPDKIQPLDIYKLLYISKQDQDKIIKTYQDVIKKSISSDKYKKVENVIQKVNGIDTNTTVYALGINEKEFYNLLVQILQTLKQDELTQNLIIDKVNTIMEEPFINAGYSTYQLNAASSVLSRSTSSAYRNKTNNSVKEFKLTKEDLIKGIDNAIEELNDEIEEANESSVAEIVLYVANGETVRLELKADEEVQMAIDNYKDGDVNHIEMSVMETTYASKYSRYSSANSASNLNKIMEVEYKTTKNGDTKNTEGKFVIYDSNKEEATINFNISTKGKIGNGTNENSYKIGMTTEDISMTLNVESKIEFTDNIQIEDLNNNNSTILNQMDKTELTTFFNKLGTKFQQEIQKKSQELGLTANDLNSSRSYNTYSNSSINMEDEDF